MKYKPEDYLDSNFYGCEEDGIENYKKKIVKCRKPHKCACGCETEIKIGDYAFLETGFLDGEPVSCYTCLICIDKWLDELHGLEDDEDDAAHDGGGKEKKL